MFVVPRRLHHLVASYYFVTLIDDLTRYTWIFALKSKSEVFTCFCHFIALVETETSLKIANMETDRGCIYVKWISWFHGSPWYSSRGIISPLTSLDKAYKICSEMMEGFGAKRIKAMILHCRWFHSIGLWKDWNPPTFFISNVHWCLFFNKKACTLTWTW